MPMNASDVVGWRFVVGGGGDGGGRSLSQHPKIKIWLEIPQVAGREIAQTDRQIDR